MKKSEKISCDTMIACGLFEQDIPAARPSASFAIDMSTKAAQEEQGRRHARTAGS